LRRLIRKPTEIDNQLPTVQVNRDGIRDGQSYAVIGAAMEVHRILGFGFLEAVYQDALAAELNLQAIPFEREKLLQILYKGRLLPSYYRADFVCFGGLLVECKALPTLTGTEAAQVINYLRITRLERALLLNFGTSTLQYKRVVLTQK
jgi:GxxExxY protein